MAASRRASEEIRVTPLPLVLQMCPFSSYLEQQLRARFEVMRWYELDAAARAPWLTAHAGRVRGIATGGHVGCPAELMQALPALAVISINGVGVDKVDLALAAERGVQVATTPGVLTADVADLAVGLVIALLRDIPAADAFVRAGAWPGGDKPLARRVSGCRFGIVGMGQIGLATAQRLAAFGPVAYTGPRSKPVPYAYYAALPELAGAVDVLVLTLPANPQTRHMVDARVLDALGPKGYLVNVARGAVVDEAALITALQAGRIAGAALDVFEDEPNVPAALRQHPRVVLTPHMATATVETRLQMADRVLANLDARLS
jgi:lactate dehydrogenase-like 2-hydroxyacid dehydrogenase